MEVTRWKKAAPSEGANNCVELAHTGDEVRDSKNADAPTLRVQFAHLVAAVKDDRINR